MDFTDTHSHLFLKEFSEDIDGVIERAVEEGVKKIFLPNVDSSTIYNLMNLAKKYPDLLFPMIGLHPSSVKENYKEELKLVNQLITEKKFYGIGETGIDLYWDKTYAEQQKEAFKEQINIAKKNKLPVIIHSRESFNEIFKILDNENDENLKGIFHCFTGNHEQAKKITGYGGFKIGIGGVLTYKNSGLDQIVKDIDLQHIVLETDSPYLAPVPKRGQRNESSFIKYVAQKIADIKGITIDEVAEITTKNALELFNL